MPTSLKEQFEESGIEVKKAPRQFTYDKGADTHTQAQAQWLHRWAKHAAQNYPIVSRSAGVRFLEDSLIGVPVFIVGIGPSLDKNIKDLKLVGNRGVIFASDAAVRPLLANGIKPDLVMTYDCKREQQTLWETAPTEDMLLVANSCTHPDTIRTWRGPLMFYNQFHKQDEFVQKLLPHIYPHIGQVRSAGTVGNMLIQLAHNFGCKPIYTVGMDLCYEKINAGDGTNIKHAYRYRCTDYSFHQTEYPDGCISPDGGWKPTENKVLYENSERVAKSKEETIREKIYRTDPELKVYRECLVSLCELMGIQIVDCSDEGILREYFSSKPLVNAISESCMEELPGGRMVLSQIEKIIPNAKEIWLKEKTDGHNY